MLLTTARGLIAHALPILIAQLSSIGMMLVDTAVLGHVSSADLAAVAIGGGIHVSLVFALVGIVQAVAPMVAHLHGAGEHRRVAGVLQQGLWLALALSLPGMLLLAFPGVLLDAAGMEPTVDAKVKQYLRILALGLPPALAYRTFYAYCNALGRPRVLMLIGLAALALHALLAWGLGYAGWSGEPLGVAGCAWSNVIIAWTACLVAVLHLQRGPRHARPLSGWQRPHGPTWRELLRLGLPMGVSNFVEITSFTLIALLIASLGATVVAGHRIVANLSALAYMLPLSLGIAVMAAVGQSLGARDGARVRLQVRAGLWLAAASSLLTGGGLWLAAGPLTAGYTDDPAVRAMALALVPYVAAYQFFDALQTIAGHVLRACRVTFVPMLLQTACFWGIGLGAGYWLCHRAEAPLGAAGFWLAAVISLGVASAVLLPLMDRVLRELAPDS